MNNDIPHNPIAEDLRTKARNANRRLLDAVQALDHNDVQRAIESAKDVFKETEVIFDGLAVHYREALFEGRLAHLFDDKAALETLAGGDPKSADLDKLLQLLMRLDRTLALASAEIDHNYPRPWASVVFLHRGAKKIILGSVLAVLAIGVIALARRGQMKHRGLTGAYFAGTNFESFYRFRQDQTIDFNWEMNSPISGWISDNFSIRWRGYLRVPKTQNYEIATHSDDGVRVIIDNKTVIENWTVHRVAVDSVVLPLTEGLHPITIEFFDRTRRAVMRLLWKSDLDPHFRVVPSENLAPLDDPAQK